ncbi:MAG TPA: response regulator transcription factor [Herpetosiphonaceae bacterium]
MTDPLSHKAIPESHRLRVVVADDHPIMRSGIANELRRHPDIEVIGEAVNGDQALALVRSYDVDVLVLDVNMPGLKALHLLRELEALRSPTRVLIITGQNDSEYVITLIKSGAKGYLLKDEEPATITTAVRTVARGKTWLSPQVLDTVLDHTVRDTDTLDEPELSSRETEVLRLLSEGRSNQEIGEQLGISERTVRFHLRNIYDKLGLKRGQAIAWAVRNRLGEE